jgi:hypothetical protein
MEAMTLNSTVFDYLSPNPEQMEQMNKQREAAKTYADVLDELLPSSPDKTYLMRKLREVSMWANIAITRHPDGTPR